MVSGWLARQVPERYPGPLTAIEESSLAAVIGLRGETWRNGVDNLVARFFVDACATQQKGLKKQIQVVNPS